jgi:competence protein ComFB
MEIVVEEMLPDFIHEYENTNKNFCQCEKCIIDLKCITLNHLKPAYFSTNLGGVYLKIEELKQQYLVDIMSELTKAAIIVSENPRHNINEE